MHAGDTLGCIITLDSPVLPILPGRVLLLAFQPGASRLVSTLRAFQALAFSISASAVPARPGAHEEPLLIAVRFYAGGEATGRLAEVLTSGSRRLERADKR